MHCRIDSLMTFRYTHARCHRAQPAVTRAKSPDIIAAAIYTHNDGRIIVDNI
jgi:hypothetical protein